MKTNRICASTTICILLLFCLVQLQTTTPTFVSASLCQITNVAYDYPQQVQPNQQVLLTSTISASCAYSDPGIYYLAMVVVNDATSGQEISINSTPIGYVSLQQPNVTATISNLITCPSGNVAWQLRLTVYVINDYNQYFSPSQDTALIHYLTVNVGTPQQQQQTVSTTTTVSPTITSTTTQMITNTTTPATSLETSNNQSSITSQSITILGLAILIVLLILVWKQRTMRKQNTDSDKTDTVRQKKENET